MSMKVSARQVGRRAAVCTLQKQPLGCMLSGDAVQPAERGGGLPHNAANAYFMPRCMPPGTRAGLAAHRDSPGRGCPPSGSAGRGVGISHAQQAELPSCCSGAAKAAPQKSLQAPASAGAVVQVGSSNGTTHNEAAPDGRSWGARCPGVTAGTAAHGAGWAEKGMPGHLRGQLLWEAACNAQLRLQEDVPLLSGG